MTAAPDPAAVARAEERAAIVAWLRADALREAQQEYADPSLQAKVVRRLVWIADAIERGSHLRQAEAARS